MHMDRQKRSPLAVPDEVAEDRPHSEEPQPALLPGFERDRQRVLNCSAFRRLQYKTQVFVNHEGDHYRTRLTHTLEVAQIARTMAAAMGLNSVLAETLAVVHDLGHPPFGHAGEQALQELMRDHGRFDHNLQALRVVDVLEHPYRQFYGLNLANVIRFSLPLHETPYDEAAAAGHVPESRRQAPLEAQVVAAADRIAYDTHDIEDGLGAGLLGERELNELQLWRDAAAPIRRRWPDEPLAALRRPILDAVTFRLIEDVLAAMRQALAGFAGNNWEDVCAAEKPLVRFSGPMQQMLEELEAFLAAQLYQHPRVAAMDYKARLIVRGLFAAYTDNPALLPQRYSRRIDQQGLHRVVCDYIAGMTDRFCQDEYRRLFEPFPRL